jgi:hypothetical protein
MTPTPLPMRALVQFSKLKSHPNNNQIGMPIGIAPTFIINSKHYIVPMAVEEPSVIGISLSLCHEPFNVDLFIVLWRLASIAAAAGAAKTIAEAAGGFIATTTGYLLLALLHLFNG